MWHIVIVIHILEIAVVPIHFVFMRKLANTISNINFVCIAVAWCSVIVIG